ncbi:hypothetical protein SZMC14600_22440, partial [Saccharomonospora azurea SZMC 14600]|uniref:hypothetical protein n=1 Tax=Saccharomonospora azurea TaxID=40988 RepID=UPI00023FFC1F
MIQARRNDWNTTDSAGAPVVNRDLYRISSVWPDGVVLAQRLGDDAVVRLTPEYLSEHCSLGYA